MTDPIEVSQLELDATDFVVRTIRETFKQEMSLDDMRPIIERVMKVALEVRGHN